MDAAEAKKETESKEATEASELQKALNEDQSEKAVDQSEVKTEPKTETTSSDQTDKASSQNKDAQADLYGPNFKQLIDPEPRSECEIVFELTWPTYEPLKPLNSLVSYRFEFFKV